MVEKEDDLLPELPLNYRRLESALRPPQAFTDDSQKNREHERYHNAQKDGRRKTAAKSLAKKAGGYVMCGCGAILYGQAK